MSAMTVNLGRNIKATVVEAGTKKAPSKRLVLEIDLSPAAFSSAPPSSTGKSLTLATTSGNSDISDLVGAPVKIGINAYTPNRS